MDPLRLTSSAPLPSGLLGQRRRGGIRGAAGVARGICQVRHGGLEPPVLALRVPGLGKHQACPGPDTS